MRRAVLHRVLVVASLAVVGLLFLMWRSLAAEEPPPAPVVSEPGVPATAPAAPTAPAIAPRPGAGSAIVMRRPTPMTPERDPSSAPTLEAPPPPDAARTPPPEFWSELNTQVMDTETWIKECNERALASGAKLSGTAAYSFTVTRAGKKVAVTATGTEYSSIENTAISECMRDVSRKMKFEDLPEGVAGMVAYRKVVLVDGVLTENWLTEFRPIEPTTPPLK